MTFLCFHDHILWVYMARHLCLFHDGVCWSFGKIEFFLAHGYCVAGYYGFMLDVRVSVHPSVRHTAVRPFFVSG